MKEYGKNPAMVNPYQILVDYDVRVRDGSVPGGNYSEVWLKMWESIVGNEELAQTFDTVRIFKHIARNAGAKNVDSFLRVNTMGDQQVQGQVQAGNLIPFNQAAGGV